MKACCPTGYKELKKQGQEAGMTGFGEMGVTAYYCTNYMSCQHTDQDMSWAMSYQLQKKANHGEYDFAFTSLGIVIRTENNSAWYVKVCKILLMFLIDHILYALGGSKQNGFTVL